MAAYPRSVDEADRQLAEARITDPVCDFALKILETREIPCYKGTFFGLHLQILLGIRHQDVLPYNDAEEP